MAKKRKKSEHTASSLAEAMGFKNLFHNERLNFFIGLLLVIISVYLILAFISYFTTGAADQSMIEELRSGEMNNQKHEFANSCGSIGAFAASFFMKRCFGLAAFLIPVFLLLTGLRLMRVYKTNLLKWFMALMVVMLWASITFAKFLSPLFIDSHFNPGGDHGLYICQQIEGFVGAPGLTALLALVAIAFLTYVSAETIYLIRKLLNPSLLFHNVPFHISNTDQPEGEPEGTYTINTIEDPKVFDNPSTQTVIFEGDDIARPVVGDIDTSAPQTKEPVANNKEVDLTIETGKNEETASGKNLVTVGEKDLEPYDPKRDLENYHYPTLDLLKHYEEDARPFIDMAEQTANKNRIVDVLRNFGVEISSIKATVGPTITLYEITPAQGVRISKIRNLEDDIALSLSALGIRIIAPIPGKGTIGIEVPNAKPSIVSMESILNSKKFQESKMELPCAMGKTITNEVFMFDLAKMPHLLVAGATGQGKSVGLNAILTSLLYRSTQLN